ncbi:MAG: oligosaccharide flippase family protein [Clostridia bacterium]|nr:oligosaccharide flippase family protein [Clostridia bacterium]
MKSLFKAVALITFFTIITRVLGFFFKIYLSREIGAEALGIYQVAFSILMVLITFVASGMPLIISKLSASLHSKGEAKEERSMVATALVVSVIIACITCLIVLLLNNFLKYIFTDERCVLILILMLPAVIFNAIYSTFRGWFWGRSNYFGLCIVELFEQVVRIVVFVLMIGGVLTVLGGAVTAGISLTIACFLSAVFVTILFFAYGGRLSKPKGYAKELIKTSTPITFVRVASSLVQPIIAIIIPMRLVASGMPTSEALALYGIAFGMTLPFLFIPSALTGSLGMALVPDLSTAVAQKNNEHITNRITSSVLITLFISCFFVPLYMGAGENIGLFFFDNAESGQMLVFSAWIMIPLGITSITSSILNALGYEVKSMKNYIVGAILMLLSIWFLPAYIGIYSVVVGMGACMTLASILNIRMINKVISPKIKIGNSIFWIAVCSLPVASLTSFLSSILVHFMPLFFNLAISCTVGSIFFLLLCQVFDLINIKIWIVQAKEKVSAKFLRKKAHKN